MLLLDTHVWIWSVEGNQRRIGRRARRLMTHAEAQGSLRVSTATVFEVMALVAAGRLKLSRSPEQWIRDGLASPGVRVADVSLDIAVDAGSIPRLALADPLDRFLVATARKLDATLMTADAQVLAYAAATDRVRVVDAGH